jgi:hypothetical protein
VETGSSVNPFFWVTKRSLLFEKAGGLNGVIVDNKRMRFKNTLVDSDFFCGYFMSEKKTTFFILVVFYFISFYFVD